MRERTHLLDGFLDLISERVQCRACVRLPALLEAVSSHREPNPQSGQTLLNPVVEVLPMRRRSASPATSTRRASPEGSSRDTDSKKAPGFRPPGAARRRRLLQRDAHPHRIGLAIAERTVGSPPRDSSMNTSPEVTQGERITLEHP